MSRVGWLELQDFRCHPAIRWEPEQGINVLVGPNGAGKTSILEAIAYASSLRSFRRTPDASLIRDRANAAVIRLGVERPAGELQIEIQLSEGARRRVQVNGKRPGSNADVAMAFPTVAFLPDDLDLVKGSPGIRREFVDGLAAQLSIEAGAVQREYARALRQRNALLKKDGRLADRDALSAWDEQLAVSGAAVLTARIELLRSMTPVARHGFVSVAGAGLLDLGYRSSWWEGGLEGNADDVAEALRAALAKRRSRDFEVRTTTAGPHRDEPWLGLNGRAARNEASQGEQRSIALALRVASFEMLFERSGRRPVLLLDDVFSELDPDRARGVLRLVPEGQVFVTSARQDEVPLAGTTWIVGSGKVERST